MTHQHGSCRPAFNAHGQTFGIGHKQIVADQLATIAKGLGQEFPTVPIILITSIFNADDWVVFNQGSQIGDIFCGAERLAFALQFIDAIFALFARSAIQGEVNVFAGLVAGFLNSLYNEI